MLQRLHFPIKDRTAAFLSRRLERLRSERNRAFTPKKKAADEPIEVNTQSMVEYEKIRIQLTDVSRTIMRLGHMLQSCGASAYRIKISMARLATALGADEHHVQVTFGEISSTVYLRPFSRTEISEQRDFGTNAAKLDRLRLFIQNIKPDTPLSEANRLMNRIESYKPEFNKVANTLAAGFACACFCFLNRGGLIECVLAGLAAGFGQTVRRMMMSKKTNHFAVWMTAGFAASLVYIGCAVLLETMLQRAYSPAVLAAIPPWITADPLGFRVGIVSAVLFLVPGFPLITSMLDLVRLDLSAGIPRLVYTLMLIISAGASVWIVSLTFQWAVDPAVNPPLEGHWLYLARTFCSFVASAGFAMLLNSTRRLCVYAGLICAVVNPLRFFVVESGFNWQFSVGLEALAIGLLADVISRLSNFNYSRVSLSVPAAVLMVPGVPLYSALVHLNEGNTIGAIASLSEVSVVILAIGIGLSTARMLTDRNWLQDKEIVDTHPVLNADTDDSFSMR
ncbi:threonine/serine exporter ThrE family protein [uncultured Mobiluncus sp.]|mgnify:FL=1|uniref:threonine/serine ThrE exporter family protein n=1 Tax=uncultured Mobiluncus sp. TaxID=293425 RepID=UPI00262E9D3A|nr:threonine/serine exporter family protein [uncultured Mobiluncus sp.]